jgi:glutathione synthase/RimK-type ligase-like ATP-grasp enzyme
VFYYGRPSALAFKHVDSALRRNELVSEARLGIGGVLLSHSAPWMNHPARGADAEFKPLQLKVAGLCGFSVPRTLVSNDTTAVNEFAGTVGGKLVCKRLSRPFRLRTDGTATSVPATVIDPTVDWFSVEQGICLYQEIIAVRRHLRVVATGRRALAAEIHVRGDVFDWRDEFAQHQISKVAVPDELRAPIESYLDAFGLHYGAFDFGGTEDGRWWFFECNQSGSWTWLAERAGVAIEQMLCDELVDLAS